MSSEYAKAAARKYYHKVVRDPEKKALRDAKRVIWFDANREDQRRKQRDKKRERKAWAIEYLGGCCSRCSKTYHPAVYEFHHRDPAQKDRDPSKMLQLSLVKLTAELDKCDLLCANCHRITHHGESY